MKVEVHATIVPEQTSATRQHERREESFDAEISRGTPGRAHDPDKTLGRAVDDLLLRVPMGCDSGRCDRKYRTAADLHLDQLIALSEGHPLAVG